jgi:hypothetical protein
MPSSLIIVALVVAWLVVLVPMIVRKRQAIARTADSALAARVVRSAEEEPMRDAEEVDEAQPPDAPEVDEPAEKRIPPPLFEPAVRGYRPGRGGFDPEAAAVLAQAKYAFRQRVVLVMIIGAVLTGVAAVIVDPRVWWVHGAIDLALVTYLGYLRRQVRIEQEIRERRAARMRAAQRTYAQSAEPAAAPPAEPADEYEEPEEPPRRTPVAETPSRPVPSRPAHPGAVVVDVDDEDPAFDDLARPDNLPYRRAAGE